MKFEIIFLLLFGVTIISCVENKKKTVDTFQVNSNRNTVVADSLNMSNLTRALNDSNKTESFIITQYFHDSLPADVYKLKRLKELYVSRTYMSEVSKQICDLSRLELLELDFNRIVSIENIVCLKKLRYLSLVGNSLHRLPADLSSLSQLWFLDISNNQFKNGIQSRLPPNIEELRIANSQLDDFPREILELKKLKRLNLSGNLNIKSIPPEIGLLVDLKELTISNTGLNYDFKLRIQKLIPNCEIYD